MNHSLLSAPAKTTRPRIRHWLSGAFLAGLVANASAAIQYWDVDGDSTTATGGTGIWSDANTWRSDSSTGTLGNWVGYNDAVFGGTAGTVTSTGISLANSAQFDVSGYILTGGTVQLGAPAGGPGFYVVNGGTATISSTLANSGAGTTIHIGKSGYAGTLALDGNFSALTSSNRALAIDYGNLTLSTATTSLNGSTGGITIASGATLTYDNSGIVNWGTAAATTLSGTGTFVKKGAGNLIFGSGGQYVNVNLGVGALFDLQGGYLESSSSYRGLWTNNYADLNVASGATFGLKENMVYAGALTGAGTLSQDYAGAGLTLGRGDRSGTFSGVIKDGASFASLTKVGTGTQTLTGTNPYTGATTLNGGTLVLSGAAGTIHASSGVVIGSATTLLINNTGTANNSNRLKDAGTVTMNGGSLIFANDAATATNFSETTGALTVATGVNTITNSRAAVGQSSALTFASLTRTGGLVHFSGPGLGADSRNRILFTSNPTLSNNLIGGWATCNGTGWASYDASNGVIAYNGYTDIAALGSSIADDATTNVRINATGSGGNIALGGATTAVNSLLQATATAATVDTAGKNLAASGIMIGTGQQALTIGAAAGDGTLTVATAGGTLILQNHSSNALTINAAVANNTSTSNVVTFGNVRLNGVNTYTGTTTAYAGTVSFGSALNQTLSGAINGDGNLAKSGAGTLTLDGTNSYTGTTMIGAGTLQISGSGSLGSGTYAPMISNNGALAYSSSAAQTISGTISGTGSLTKDTGAGTLTLSASNTYTGGTTISSGTIVVTNSSALGAGTITLSGGTLQDSTTDVTLGNPVVATAATTSNVSTATNKNFGLSGNITGSGNLNLNPVPATTSLYLSGNNSGFTGTITAANAGTNTRISNTRAASANAAWVVNGIMSGEAGGTFHLGSLSGSGVLCAGNSSNAVFSVGALNTNTTFSGTIANSGAGCNGLTAALLKTGSGILTLTGANTYTGATSVNGGTLELGGANGSILTTTALTIGGGGTLNLANTGAVNNSNRISDAGAITMIGGTLSLSHDAATGIDFGETGGVLNVASGSNTVSNNQAATGQASTLAFASLNRTGGTVDFTGAGLGLDATNRILFTTNPPLTADGMIGLWATYNGAGWAGYDATNGVIAFTGHTDIDAYSSTIADGSTTNVRINTDINPAGNIVLGGTTTTVNTLLQATDSAATVDTEAKTFATSAIMIGAGQQALTIGTAAGSGNLTATTAGGNLVLLNKSSNDLTINAVIADNTSASSLSASGAVTLAATNTYTGTTTVNGGVLSVAADANLGTAPGVATAGSLVLNGGALAATTGFTLNANRGIAVGPGSGTLDVAGSQTLTYSGIIANNGGTGALVKANAGTLILTGTNTYTGGTTITGGTLQVGTGGATGSLGSGNILDNGSLVYNLNNTATVSLPTISGSGSFTATAGLIQFNGDVTLGGAQTITQNSVSALYKGLEVVTASTLLTGSSISLTGDLGKRNSAGNTLTLDTSAVNGPINLNISLGRNNVWYNISGFSANAGTGPLTISGAYSPNAWNAVTTSLTGALAISSNMPLGGTINLRATGTSTVSGNLTNLTGANTFHVDGGVSMTVSGQMSGSGSITKQGAGTLTVSAVQNDGIGAMTVAGGTLQLAPVPVAPPVPGYSHWFDASTNSAANLDLTGTTVNTWLNKGSSAANAMPQNAGTSPTWVPNAVNGLGAIHFSPGSGTSNATGNTNLVFNRDSSIRTVFAVFKGSSFLLTDSGINSVTSYYDFHRVNDNDPAAPLWDATYSHLNIRNGTTYVNGAAVNGTSFAMPTALNNGFNLVAVQTTGPVTANGFNRDRTYHSGDQYMGEVVIYNRALTTDEIKAVQIYLGRKWGLSGFSNGTNVLNTATPVSIASGSTLDLGGVSQQVASLSDSAGGGGSVVNSGTESVVLTLSPATGSTTFSGIIGGGAGGAISLTKSGTGTQILAGTHTYTGATTVTEGTLVLGNGASINASSLTTVGGGSSSATLSVAGANAIGTVSTGALLFGSNSITATDLRTSAIPGADLINVEGNLSFDSGAQLTLNLAGTSTLLTSGTELALMDYSGFSWDGDTFLGKPNKSTFPFDQNRWTIRYDDTTYGTTTGNFVTLTVATPYEVWASLQTPALLADSQAGDADNDGKTNLLEYAFGTNPNSGASGPNSIMYVVGGDVTTPGAPVVVEEGGTYYAVFGRRKDYLGKLTYTVRFSADLDGLYWSASAVTPVLVTGNPSAGDIEAVKVPYPGLIPTAGDPQKARFFQVVVTETP